MTPPTMLAAATTKGSLLCASLRRNAKIVEAVLHGDSWESVARRWGLAERGLYEILYEHKRRVRMSASFWRQTFLSRRSAFR